jgi:hypothetical protein
MCKKGLPIAAVAIVAVGLAIAGAAARPAPSADLSLPVSTPVASALQKLMTTGVLPTDVRGEPGVWNFAGPAAQCPGPGWNCVTPGVLPITQNGTVNIAVAANCTGGEQNGVVNKMECIHEQKSGQFAHQTCGTASAPIEQDADHNELICKLIYDVTTTKPTQCVLQEAHFDQDGVTNKFKGQLRIVQQMSTKSGGSQRQDARQRINGVQDAEEKNESEVEQVQIQKATGNATSQSQNAGCAGVSGAPPAAGDCTDSGGDSPISPYTCLKVDQRVDDGGDNISKLKQEVKEDALTSYTGSSVTSQQQGEPDGGNDGDIDQEVGSESELAGVFGNGSSDEGKSLGVADQYTYQTLPTRGGLNQEQYEDPSCCFGSQDGGGRDSEEVINQWVEQKANDDALQVAKATGESRSPGKCTINHDLRNNGGTVDESASEPSEPEDVGCPFLEVRSECTSGGGGGGFTTLEVTGTCTSTTTDEDEVD